MKKIMLVDDSMTLLMSMQGILKREGFDVTTASSGQLALQKIDAFKPDLIITDLNMPGMDGIEFIRESKKMAAMRFKPMLMLTTESQQGKRDEAKQAGAMGWLVKPVAPEQLTQVVRQVLPGA